MYIRIFSHTTKENIIKNWSIVKNEKKLLNDWSKKNKNRKDFKRDLEIYKLYKKLKNVRRIRNNKGENIYRNKRLDEEISSIIMDKYEDLSWENIRKIITRMKKLDTEFVTNK